MYCFSIRSRLFINASGSGKTRILLEGLCRYWGLYLVCERETFSSIGSDDLASAIRSLASTTGFLHSPLDPSQIQVNTQIASLSFSCVIAARLIILWEFLRVGRKFDTLARPTQWLHMQILPEPDIFRTLAEELFKFPDKFISRIISLSAKAIREVIGSSTLFFIVVDEAQAAATKYPNAFQSASHKGSRPVLTQILRTLCEVRAPLSYSSTTIVLSGTGIRYDSVRPIMESNISKNVGFQTVTDTGTFSPEDQRKYLIKYLFPNVTHLSEADELFINHAWRWLRGRYCC